MTQAQKADLEFYQGEARRHLAEGNQREALGCYILGRDLAGLPVADQTRRDYGNKLQAELARK